MPKVVSDYTNPIRKKPITDTSGHYDLDGVTQAQDFEVIVAGDKTAPNKPKPGFNLHRFKLKFQKWLAAWDD